MTKDCFHLKAFDVNKSSIIKASNSCNICGKTNHVTQQCTYLKSYEVTKNEFVFKSKQMSSPSQVQSKPSVKKQQAVFTPVEMAVTKPRVPHVYEALKKVSKPKVNRHSFAYQQLLGKNPQQWLESTASKANEFTTDVTTVSSTVAHSEPDVTPSKAILALDSLLN